MLNGEKNRQEITTCVLCNQPYTDPRTLPCLHIFCLQCLQKRDLSAADSSTCCPVCGDSYSGPVTDLPRNSFVVKLLRINGIAASQRTPCDFCQADGSDPSTVVMATHYCLNCTEHLCDKCYAMHGRIRSSRHHRVVEHGTQLTAQDLRGPVAQCEQHVDEPVKMFCCDCVRCICFLCYAEYHTGHRCQVAVIDTFQSRLVLLLCPSPVGKGQ